MNQIRWIDLKSLGGTKELSEALEKSLAIHRRWLDQGLQEDMLYLEDQWERKKNLNLILPNVKSLILVVQPYHPKMTLQLPSHRVQKLSLQMASYARGVDYHYWFQNRLQSLANRLQRRFPKEIFLPMTDGPLLEKTWAQLGGLGWIGKNSLLIHPRLGSFVFLGEILTTLSEIPGAPKALEPSSSSPQSLLSSRCGACRRCIDACPTQALNSHPPHLNLRRCIAYWTIEAKGSPPEDLRPQVGKWFFGCDVCQEVCPWNAKTLKKIKILEETPSWKQRVGENQREKRIEDLRFFLRASHKKIEAFVRGSPLSRARPRGLRRNAILAAQELPELDPELILLSQDSPDWSELAKWALEQREGGSHCK